jgi:hypothetical protein
MRLACLKAMASTTGRKREPVTKTGSRRLAAPPPDAANQSVLACEGAEAISLLTNQRCSGEAVLVSWHSACGWLPPFSQRLNGQRQDVRPRLLRHERHPFSMTC